MVQLSHAPAVPFGRTWRSPPGCTLSTHASPVVVGLPFASNGPRIVPAGGIPRYATFNGFASVIVNLPLSSLVICFPDTIAAAIGGPGVVFGSGSGTGLFGYGGS